MSEEMAQLYGDLREVRRALFGDLMRQEAGLVKGMDTVERAVEVITRQQEELLRLVPLVEELKRNSDERRRRDEDVRRNRLSRALLEVARILAVMLLVWPVIAWDFRPLWGGEGWMAPPAVLAVLVGGFAVGSILTRRGD